MLWRGGRRSDNVEDQRGLGGGGPGGDGLGSGGFGGGGFGGGRRVGVGGGLGLIVIVVVALLFGVDPSTLLSEIAGTPGPGYQSDQGYQQNTGTNTGLGTGTGNGAATGKPDEMKDFVSVVLADTEDTWTDIFHQIGRSYVPPHLVLFSGSVRSACGYAQAAMGPFYCPGDSKVYIDLSFYDELRNRFHAPGDFAEAYVIAHEVGHHIQHLLGITDKADQLRARMSDTDANALSVRIELQADCLAGIWANHAEKDRRNITIEPGDVEEALTAAAAIGDDRLQQQAQGYVVPDSFTHGSSAQRVKWFKTGLNAGDLNACDTSGKL